ncbi:MAG: A/G-specific adenine glycosylase [Helicobacteraceae bacterium]|nr:A/G-specific adenine glycosylase [Helicobacteraceae bacterium]
MHTKLLSWYEKHGRHDLPWRNTSDVYHVYVSEVMLQQTQVKRVLEEYYFQFLERFPTLETLASAPLDDVFSLWSGLGYYRRARNLHATAQLCAPALPTTSKELLALPGIGRYTASAICSFGYNQKISVVDTNIARVLTRYLGLRDPKEKELWSAADSLLHPKEVRSHNLALMDLGSLVCLPKNPLCDMCPLLFGCKAKENLHLFTKTTSKEYIDQDLYFGIYRKKEKLAFRKSREGMYKDMLELPRIEFQESGYIGTFKHSVTKYRLSISLYELEEEPLDVEYISLYEIERAPISSMTKKALTLYLKR